jgi:hypothetical protein
MYTLVSLYWDWIAIFLIASGFSLLLVGLSLLVALFSNMNGRMYWYSCPSCSATRCESPGHSITNRVVSSLNIGKRLSGKDDGKFKPATDRNHWTCLFDELCIYDVPTYSQETPLGRMCLLKGVGQTWPSDSCESYIYSGVIGTLTECWIITCSYPDGKGGMHPLEVEYLMANCLRELHLCPEPLYLSSGYSGIYGSFTKVEERYMLYQLPTNSEFITALAFKNKSDYSKHLKVCCTATIGLLSAVTDLHASGISHGALDDDAVVVVNDTTVLLVNLLRVSNQASQQLADIKSIFEIFSYIVSRGRSHEIHDLRGLQDEGRPCIRPGLLRHIKEMETMLSSGVIPSYQRIMKCLKDLQGDI